MSSSKLVQEAVPVVQTGVIGLAENIWAAFWVAEFAVHTRHLLNDYAELREALNGISGCNDTLSCIASKAQKELNLGSFWFSGAEYILHASMHPERVSLSCQPVTKRMLQRNHVTLHYSNANWYKEHLQYLQVYQIDKKKLLHIKK